MKTTTDILKSFRDKTLDFNELNVNTIGLCLDHISDIKKTIYDFKKKLDEELQKKFDNELESKRKEKPFGVISIVKGDFIFSETKPMKVNWDQDVMRKIYDKIKATGDNPDNYINTKYSVYEKTYSSMGSDIQNVFNKAREVSYGTTSIKLKKGEK